MRSESLEMLAKLAASAPSPQRFKGVTWGVCGFTSSADGSETGGPNSCPYENLHLELKHPLKGTSETNHRPLLPFSQSLYKPFGSFSQQRMFTSLQEKDWPVLAGAWALSAIHSE